MPDMTRDSLYGSPNLDHANVEGTSTLVGDPSVQEQRSRINDKSLSSLSPRPAKQRNFSNSSDVNATSKSPNRKRSISNSANAPLRVLKTKKLTDHNKNYRQTGDPKIRDYKSPDI